MSEPAPSAPFICPDAFREFLDQPEFFVRLFQTFILETRQDLENLEAASMLPHAAKAAGIAHRIKGGAAAVGAEPLRAEAARVEILGREGRLPEVRAGVGNLREEFARFCRFVAGRAAPGEN